MCKVVTVKVMGQPAKAVEDFTGETVAELKAHLNLTGNYTANVSGEAASDDTDLDEGAYIVFAPAVKGA